MILFPGIYKYNLKQTHSCNADQNKVFEFLWQNISGSMEPSFMKEKSKANGYVML